MESIIKRAEKHVHVRHLRKSHFDEDTQIVRDIFEDAWSQNWGFIPFTAEEFRHLARDMKQLVPPDLVAIAEVNGVPAAMMVAFPNINEIIGDLNGRLLPLGWLKLLWRLKVRFPKSARVPLMGVRQEFQKSRQGAALALMVIKALQPAALRRGIQQVELSWILEDNAGMRSILDGIGAKAYKRYRLYTTQLA